MSGRCFKTCRVSTCIALQSLLQSEQLLPACATGHQQAASAAEVIKAVCMLAKANMLSNYRCMDVPLSKAQKGHLLQESSREPHPE